MNVWLKSTPSWNGEQFVVTAMTKSLHHHCLFSFFILCGENASILKWWNRAKGKFMIQTRCKSFVLICFVSIPLELMEIICHPTLSQQIFFGEPAHHSSGQLKVWANACSPQDGFHFQQGESTSWGWCCGSNSVHIFVWVIINLTQQLWQALSSLSSLPLSSSSSLSLSSSSSCYEVKTTMGSYKSTACCCFKQFCDH